MKKTYLFTILWSFIFNYSIAQDAHTNFSKNEILKDLDYLYNSLIDAHYNIYAYVKKEEFFKNFIQVKKSINTDSVSLLQAINSFQKVISAANNGHTEIDFPVDSYKSYANNSGTLFPLEIAFENNKSWVRKNFSNNSQINIGSEIISINGLLMKEILTKIYPQISAERSYFKNAKIEMYSFPRVYWQVFGKQDRFEVEIIKNGEVKKYTIEAIKLIEDYEIKRAEVLNAQMKLKFYGNTVYLNPGNFSGVEAKYRQFIDSSFAEITTYSKKLIIDLRNNSGGNDSFSDYLVSYIADKPFKWNSKFTLKTSEFLKEHTRLNNDTTGVYFQNILIHKNGEIYDYVFNEYQPQVKQKRFSGKVYVLINRQSHSQSAVTAAQIQDYKFGIIVGEETGDFPSLYASQFHYNLPNTKVPVKVAKGYIVRVNGSIKQEGVIPDIFIKDYLLDEEDEILNSLLNKLKEKN